MTTLGGPRWTVRRTWVGLACSALLLAGCTGGDDEEKKSSLPLPDKPPAAAGPATGPALEAKALFAAADDLEEQVGSLDTALVERRSGAFISGSTAVGYSVDDISGYDLESGDQLWTAKLDLKGGSVCFVSQPDRAVKRFTVVYGDGTYCASVATVRVADGKVLSNMAEQDLGATFEGEPAGGAFENLLTVDGKDYLIDMRGVVWRATAKEPEPIARLKDDSYFDLFPSADGTLLVGSRLSDPECNVDAYELPSFEPVWTTPGATAFPDQETDCVVSLSPGDPTWAMQQIGSTYHMTKLDPASGEPLGSAEAPTSPPEKPLEEGTFDLASAANQFDRSLAVGKKGEMIFAQARGLSRYSLETKKQTWELDLTQLEQASDERFPLRTVLPQGLTADGYLVATVSNDTTTEVIAVDAAKGTLVGRWPLPEEYANGFQVEPGATLYEDGLVLTRNFESWQRTFDGLGELEAPEGDLFDIGVFTFPEPGEEVAPQDRPVPTAGPIDVDAEPLASIEADDPDATASVGAVYTGSTVVTYVGNRLQAYDTKGKKTWKGTLGDDPEARVCAASDPDRKATSILLSYREGDRCTGLMRVGSGKGKQVEVDVPAAKKSVGRIVTHDGTDFVIAEDDTINRVDGDRLVEVADLGLTPYYWQRTPEDPSLVVVSAKDAKGGDWTVQAFRAPTFEKVWSAKASALFGKKPDADNTVSPFSGNGLWVGVTFGTYTGPESTLSDSLVKLDPATGKVVAKTGTKERAYGEPDLTKLDLTSAVVGGYVSVGFEDGSVVMTQNGGIVRYSLEDDEMLWTVDTSSIETSMEKARRGTYLTEDLQLTDGGRSVLVTLSNEVSTELMTIDAKSGKITGRWKLAADARNGLQVSPDVTPWKGGVALTRNDYSWSSTYGPDAPNDPPKGPVLDVGLFALDKPAAPKD